MPLLMIRETLISYDFRYEHYAVPKHIRNIAERCFNERWELEWLELPAEMDSIGNLAFRKCISLRRIDMPKSAKSVGNALFTGCSNLRSVAMPTGTRIIDYEMFRDCSELKEIILPNTVTEIHSGAFSSCPKLRDLIVPSTLFSALPDALKPVATLTFMGRANSNAHASSDADCDSSAFDSYARNHESDILSLAIRRNDRKAVLYMTTNNMMDPSRIPYYLEMANLAKRTEIAAVLLEYSGHIRFGLRDALNHKEGKEGIARGSGNADEPGRKEDITADAVDSGSGENEMIPKDLPDMYDWDPFAEN